MKSELDAIYKKADRIEHIFFRSSISPMVHQFYAAYSLIDINSIAQKSHPILSRVLGAGLRHDGVLGVEL